MAGPAKPAQAASLPLSTQDGRLVVSSIYLWYEADFGGTEQVVIERPKRYARPELAALLAGIDPYIGRPLRLGLNELRQ